ncbi:hypothetical protein LEN26_015905 [Aphanomyces euteiches]|nr:hypothetical protein LEN26_015905 [Aphanomyces euteiches]KAH9127400.1 hypothetical protein AeMF1_002299 [Aphanomyces euteiches]KAH9189809.1 hypothetical protein AeNC1_008222 [Aphanomyces euteiches]
MGEFYDEKYSLSREKGGKKAWSPDEDQLIITLVARLGCKHWSKLAKVLNDESTSGVMRTGKQCRERWHNHLDASIKKGPWTHEEEELLEAAHAEHGNQWSKIAKLFHGRTDNAIKNRWFAKQRREMRRNNKMSGRVDAVFDEDTEEQMTPRPEAHDRIRSDDRIIVVSPPAHRSLVDSGVGGISPKPEAWMHSSQYSHHSSGPWHSGSHTMESQIQWRSLQNQMDELGSLGLGVMPPDEDDAVDVNGSYTFGMRQMDAEGVMKRERSSVQQGRGGYPYMEIDLDWTEKVLI